jgi:hypothetical protein
MPAELSWGEGKATFAVNRRTNKEADVVKLKAENKILGPSDHAVPVLLIKDASGKTKGIVFGYACHSTTLSFFQWCGDYPGFAMLELEKRHPGAIALFWAGCGADQNPLPRRTVELAQNYGNQLADSVDAVLKQPKVLLRKPTARYLFHLQSFLHALSLFKIPKAKINSKQGVRSFFLRNLKQKAPSRKPTSIQLKLGNWEMARTGCF